MDKTIVIKESVRGIIEYVLKRGSIDDRYVGKNRSVEGTLAHKKLQKSNKDIYEVYEKEVKLEEKFLVDGIELIIEGRADGIIKIDNNVYIEEIKSTYKDIIFIDEDYNELHWAQGKFYAYIYSFQNNLDNIYVKLSYFNVETEEVKSFDRKFSFIELEDYVNDIISKYKKMVNLSLDIIEERNETIKNLKFPFKSYRKGQRELAVASFNTIKEGGVLFSQAPTGIGKTISTLFPAIKALESNKGKRIVYLTAKTVTRKVAEDTIDILKSNNLKCKSITLTSKEKICFKEKVRCNPEYCEYAKDYYEKINNLTYNLLKENSTFTREKIEEVSRENKVCPFELSLDLSSFCDVIICDYNYAFDPRARLKRFFEEAVDENIILVDEAHNLVDRARNMFSAEINKKPYLEASRLVKKEDKELYKSLRAINEYCLGIKTKLKEEGLKSSYKKEEDNGLYKVLNKFLKVCDIYLVKNFKSEHFETLKELYYSTRNFMAIREDYDDNYVTLVEEVKNSINIKLYCINPSKNLEKIIRESYASILFSATLSPINYYIDLLGGDLENSYRLRLPSPFDKENLKVYRNNLNMRYGKREENIEKLCHIINRFIKEEIGNYMVFLPSYDYLNKVYSKYIEIYGEDKTIIQGNELTEIEKVEFLNNFEAGRNIVAFCVIGGMFSEGIDLPGEKLIGSIIVGMGFPKVSNEVNIIKDYYEDKGFDYAYVYPGINKVMQAAGRVIRREEDKGRVLLVDDRYFNRKYTGLLPSEWNID